MNTTKSGTAIIVATLSFFVGLVLLLVIIPAYGRSMYSGISFERDCNAAGNTSVQAYIDCNNELNRRDSTGRQLENNPLPPALIGAIVLAGLAGGITLMGSTQKPTLPVVNQPSAAPNAKPLEQKCTHCGATNPAESKFCGECGTPLFTQQNQKAERKCTKCGALNPVEKSFCSNCGLSLS